MNIHLPKTTAEAVRTYDLMVLLDAYTGEVPTSRRFTEADLMPTTGYPRELTLHKSNPWAKTPTLDALVDCPPWTNGIDDRDPFTGACVHGFTGECARCSRDMGVAL